MRTWIVGGVLAVVGCQTAKKEEAKNEPQPARPEVVDVVEEEEFVFEPVNLGSNPNCDINVIGTSPHAVGDPCLTTTEFIDSLTQLTPRQRDEAISMVQKAEQTGEQGILAH